MNPSALQHATARAIQTDRVRPSRKRLRFF
jgi:hypothetical protein